MTEYHIEDDSPLVIANVASAKSQQMGATENYVAWDLVSGRVTQLPQRVFDAKRFGKRILAKTPQGVSWFDLDSGRERSVVCFGAEQPPSKYHIVAAWLIAWFRFVRPTNEGDFTRRFGAAFMILIIGALSISRLKSANFYLEWPVMEWAMCGAFFLPLLGMLIAALIQRSVSWFMLGSGWTITLLLLAGLIFAGESQSYDATLFNPTTPTSTPMTPVRNAAWLYINHPGEFITAPADPISTTGGWFGPTPEYRVEFLSESVSERQP